MLKLLDVLEMHVRTLILLIDLSMHLVRYEFASV